MRLHLNIGTNIGDRRANLARAVAAIEERFGPVRLAPVVQSEPWGFTSPNRFLNLGVAVEVPDDSDPLQLLDDVQHAEHSVDTSSHRNPDGTYRDRVIDIDIVALGEICLTHPRLTLPHPRLHERDFFLQPYQWLENHLRQSCPLDREGDDIGKNPHGKIN